MQLYAGSTTDFLTDAIQHRVAEKLGESYYEYFRFRASASEFASWQNSLTALTAHIQYSDLRDHGIALEMQLPLTSARLDAMITGHDTSGAERAVIIELKQWTTVEQTDIDDRVLTFLGGRLREVAHPSVQVSNYRRYLQDMNSAFYLGDAPVTLDACSWLHNLEPEARTCLVSDTFAQAIAAAPVFTGRDADAFRNFLRQRLSAGSGMPVLNRITSGRFAPSKKLLEHTARVISGEPTYTLLDEQIVAYNTVMTLARKALRAKSDRAVVVVKGGPGTGKPVLALNVMAALLKEGKSVQHATGSKAFTENLRKVLGPRARPLLQYFNSYGAADPGVVDLLVCDESHRIRSTSNNQYTPPAKKSERPQIDDFQAVRPGEVGSSAMIREAAVRHGASYRDTELQTQFRCAGSEHYIDWLDQLLEIRKTGEARLGKETGFDFRIFDKPSLVETAIREKVADGVSARMAAGFCWPWSGARFTDNVKNTYRVLLTRGMQGCYVYFEDAETRAFVESQL